MFLLGVFVGMLLLSIVIIVYVVFRSPEPYVCINRHDFKTVLQALEKSVLDRAPMSEQVENLNRLRFLDYPMIEEDKKQERECV